MVLENEPGLLSSKHIFSLFNSLSAPCPPPHIHSTNTEAEPGLCRSSGVEVNKAACHLCKSTGAHGQAKEERNCKECGVQRCTTFCYMEQEENSEIPWVPSLILKQSGVRKRLLRLWREDSEVWRNTLSISPVWDSCMGTEQVGHSWKSFKGADE